MKILLSEKDNDCSDKNFLRGKEKNTGATSVYIRMPHSKGYVYTLEAMIAIAIIVVAIIMVFSTAQVPETPNIGMIKKQGYEALEFLDQKDGLRQLVQSVDEIALKKDVRALLASGITIELDICTTQCSGQVPQNKNIVVVDYYVAGYKDSFFNKKVKMWMWGNF